MVLAFEVVKNDEEEFRSELWCSLFFPTPALDFCFGLFCLCLHMPWFAKVCAASITAVVLRVVSIAFGVKLFLVFCVISVAGFARGVIIRSWTLLSKSNCRRNGGF